MRFDAPTLARAWLSVAQASASDRVLVTLDKTVAIEEFPAGVRLVATDRFVLLTAWVPDLNAKFGREPEPHELPDRVVVSQDADGRGRGLLDYVLKIARRDDLDDYPPGKLEVNVDFDARIPAGEDADQPLEGLEPTYVVLSVPDVEKVFLPVVEAEYPSWRLMVLGHDAQDTKRIGIALDRIHRLAGLRKWNSGPLLWTFGGPEAVAMVELYESDPHVTGLVMPARWVLPGEQPVDEDAEQDEDTDPLVDVEDGNAHGAQPTTATYGEALTESTTPDRDLLGQAIELVVSNAVRVREHAPAQAQRRVRQGLQPDPRHGGGGESSDRRTATRPATSSPGPTSSTTYSAASA